MPRVMVWALEVSPGPHLLADMDSSLTYIHSTTLLNVNIKLLSMFRKYYNMCIDEHVYKHVTYSTEANCICTGYLCNTVLCAYYAGFYCLNINKVDVSIELK